VAEKPKPERPTLVSAKPASHSRLFAEVQQKMMPMLERRAAELAGKQCPGWRKEAVRRAYLPVPLQQEEARPKLAEEQMPPILGWVRPVQGVELMRRALPVRQRRLLGVQWVGLTAKAPLTTE
jgi:hypothetical protein